jgi:hypothetical protein
VINAAHGLLELCSFSQLFLLSPPTTTNGDASAAITSTLINLCSFEYRPLPFDRFSDSSSDT